jgi:hypothetical protein
LKKENITMIKCPACEAENEDGVLYCDQCGADLSTVEVPATPTPEVPPTNIPEQPVPQTNIPEQPVPQTNVPEQPVPPTNVPNTPQIPVPLPIVPGGQPTGVIQPPTPGVVPPPQPLPGQQVKLSVLRGDQPGETFQIWEGLNVIGRADPQGKPVDIDLEPQEASKAAPSVSRQHAVVQLQNGVYTLEDLGSSNGTFVNRGERLQPGQPLQLNDGDELIVGLVYLKFSLS